jgi:hypothetical protein
MTTVLASAKFTTTGAATVDGYDYAGIPAKGDLRRQQRIKTTLCRTMSAASY